MENKILVMPKLSVEVVTGDTCYPAEGGFSAIYAKVAPDDASLVRQLSHAQEHGDTITLRCAMLDATGKITKSALDDGRKVFVLSIDDITYRRPARL